MKIPIGPFRPSQPDTALGQSPYILGVQPIRDPEYGIAYAPQKAFQVIAGATALPDFPRGGASLVLADGTNQLYYMTDTTLEQAQADFTWTELKNSLTTVPSGYDWSLLHFGDDLLLTGSGAGMYAYNVESPSGVNAVSGAPSGLYNIWECANRVCGLYYDSTNERYVLANSAFNDSTTWDGSAGSDEQPLASGGEAVFGTRIFQNTSMVLQKDAIRRMTFGDSGTGAQFSLDTVVDGQGVGSVGARSVIPYRGMVAYLSASGFQLLTREGVRPIGAEKINRWFLEEEVETGTLGMVQGTVSPRQAMFWWRYFSTGNASTTTSDKLIGYDWQLDEFVLAEESLMYLLPTASPGYHGDNVDSLFSDADADLPHMDSPFWSGSEPDFGGLDGDKKTGYFNGSNMAVDCYTGKAVLPRSMFVNDVTIDTDSADATVSVGAAIRQSDTLLFGDATSANSIDGACHMAANGKVLQGRIQIAAGKDWSQLRGLRDINQAAP